uniref:Acs7 n=1 Tax=Arundo donax TaxID=35708 RepID=A0A0A8Z703_ARUDO
MPRRSIHENSPALPRKHPMPTSQRPEVNRSCRAASRRALSARKRAMNSSSESIFARKYCVWDETSPKLDILRAQATTASLYE